MNLLEKWIMQTRAESRLSDFLSECLADDHLFPKFGDWFFMLMDLLYKLFNSISPFCVCCWVYADDLFPERLRLDSFFVDFVRSRECILSVWKERWKGNETRRKRSSRSELWEYKHKNTFLTFFIYFWRWMKAFSAYFVLLCPCHCLITIWNAVNVAVGNAENVNKVEEICIRCGMENWNLRLHNFSRWVWTIKMKKENEQWE